MDCEWGGREGAHGAVAAGGLAVDGGYGFDGLELRWVRESEVSVTFSVCWRDSALYMRLRVNDVRYGFGSR